MSKNSKECYACKRPTSTFALSSHLVPWHEANEDVSVMPLEVYHPNFSVFKFTIIKKGEGSVFANIHPNDVPYIRKIDTFLYQRYMEQTLSPSSQEATTPRQSSPIFSELIPMINGTIGGYLLRNGENGVGYLRANYNQFAPQQQQWIQQAVEWFQHGELKDQLCSSINLYRNPAYTVTFKVGTHKGKTPAEIICSNQHGADILKTQESFLEKNLSKFPNNQKLIDAIHNAFSLLSQGYLLPPEKKQNSSERNSFELINSVKVDKYKTNEQGLAMVRSLRITYEFGMNNSPVSVSIENCYARFKDRDGKITFDSATKQDVKNFTFRCTLAEWEAALSMIERQMQMFETVHAAEAFRAANDLERRSREEYKNSSNPTPAHYQQQQNRPPIPNQQHQATSFNTTEVVNKLLVNGDKEVSRLRSQYRQMSPEVRSAITNIVELYNNSNGAMLPNQQTPFELLAQTRNVAELTAHFQQAGRSAQNEPLIVAISSAIKLGKMARFS